MSEVNEYNQPYFKMDRSRFVYIDENYEKSRIDEQMKLTDEERFFAMEFLRNQELKDKNQRLDWKYFEIR